MKNKFYVVLTMVFLLSAAATSAVAQQIEKGQVSVRLKDGVSIFFTSVSEPSVSKWRAMGSIQIGNGTNAMHRVFIDAERGVYFGYDLIIEPAGETGRFKLIFKPLSIPPRLAVVQQMSLHPIGRSAGANANASNRKQNAAPPTELTALALPKYPEPQMLADGDTLALEVLVNPQTGTKIIDLIKVSSSSPSEQQPQPFPAGVQASGSGGGKQATDFTVEAMEMGMRAGRIFVNGEEVGGGGKENARPGISGALIWFHLPGRGRFVLSLAPRDGYEFQKVGTIEGNKITFSLNGVRYEWVSGSPVVGVGAGNGHWNLWVAHDPDYRPDFDLTEEFPYQIGAAARAEHLLKRRNNDR